MFKSDDFNELSALHRAILAAKYSDIPENDEIAGNPVLAGLANEIYDEMTKLRKHEEINSDVFEELRRITTRKGFRGQFRAAVMTARRDPVFMSSDGPDRLAMAKCYLSPFTCTESELKAFIDAVDGKGEEQTLEKLFRKHTFSSAQLLNCNYSFANSQLRLVFLLPDRRICDLYLSGVSVFSADGAENEEFAVLKKYDVSSRGGEKLSAELVSGGRTMKINVQAKKAEYWI